MSTTSSHSIKLLFLQISEGNEAAFRQLFELYKSKIYFFILHIIERKAETEELVQDVFMRLWTSRHILASVDHPDAYLFIIAKNRSLDFIQKIISERKMKEDLIQKGGTTENNTEEHIDFHESRRLIDEAVHLLPDQQKLVFRLSKEQGLTRQEIASRLAISEHTVRNHLAEAIKFIKNWLKQHGDKAYILFLLFYI